MSSLLRLTGNEVVERWHRKMPRFFRQLAVLCTCIAGVAYAINEGLPALGGTHSEWWEEAYRYIVSACIGIVATCKLTVAGGYKHVNPGRLTNGNTILDEDIERMTAKSPTMSEPNDTESRTH